MISGRVIVTSLMLCIFTCAWCQQPGRKIIVDETTAYDGERTQKMMEKAVIKIITGNLSTQDMRLLEGLGYSKDSIMAIRQQELEKKMERYVMDSDKNVMTEGSKYEMISNGKKNNERINYDLYNQRAVTDYENSVNTTEVDNVRTILDYEDPTEEENYSKSEDRSDPKSFMQPIVIFKIRFNDTDFDSDSSGKSRESSIPLSSASLESSFSKSSAPEMKLNGSEIRNFESSTTGNNILSAMMNRAIESRISNSRGDNSNVIAKKFESGPNVTNPMNLTSSSTTAQSQSNVSPNENMHSFRSSDNYSTIYPIIYNLSNMTAKFLENNSSDRYMKTWDIVKTSTTKLSNVENSIEPVDKNNMKLKDAVPKTIREYKGLEWIEDDVYRVIPEALNYDINNMDDENETMATEYHSLESSMGKLGDDYYGYQGDSEQNEKTNTENDNETTTQQNGNLTEYQMVAQQYRKISNETNSISLKQQAIENIQRRILDLTGRSSSISQVIHRQPLTMIPPICPISRNRGGETWSDLFSMNLHFQVNLTAEDHIMEARLRIYILPRNITALSNSSMNINELDGVLNQEERIKIIIYFYSKTLKKHGTKKNLIDSKEISLSPEGSHLAMDVIKALQLWRQTPRFSHVTESQPLCGLVIQVEDQRRNLLDPELYIRQDTCPTNADEKINESNLSSIFKPVLVIYASKTEEK